MNRGIEQFVEYLHAVTLNGSDITAVVQTDSKRCFEQLRVLIRLVHPDLNIRYSEVAIKSAKDPRSLLMLCCPSDGLTPVINVIYANINHSTLARRGWAVLKYAPASTRPESALVFYPPLDSSSVRYCISYTSGVCDVSFIMSDTFYVRSARNSHLVLEARNTLLSYVRALVGEYAATKYVQSVSIANIRNPISSSSKPLVDLSGDILRLVPRAMKCMFCGVDEYRATVAMSPGPICIACRHSGIQHSLSALSFDNAETRVIPIGRDPIVPKVFMSRSLSPTRSARIVANIPDELRGSYRVIDRYGTLPVDDENESWVDSMVGPEMRSSESSSQIFGSRSPAQKVEAPILVDSTHVFMPLSDMRDASGMHTAKSTSDLDEGPKDLLNPPKSPQPDKKGKRVERAARFRRIARSGSVL